MAQPPIKDYRDGGRTPSSRKGSPLEERKIKTIMDVEEAYSDRRPSVEIPSSYACGLAKAWEFCKLFRPQTTSFFPGYARRSLSTTSRIP